MEDAKVATPYAAPMWQDYDGNPCLEKDAFGCKVTHNLTHPEMCVVMDEVGGNTSQKGDGHIGGELLVCAKGMIPKKKVNTKDKHFTVLGLTALNGDAIMCVVIFAGIREQAVVDTGMDVFAQQEGEVSDDDFFINNSGKNKRFPGGPTCVFQGKEVPCLTRWSPKGSITAQILIDILHTLDHLGVFDRSGGRIPFLLLDGHGSRFAMEFLNYIMDPLHLWAVCIGVPYGTALWQVGDASEQNGAYKMALTRAKENLIKQKIKKCMPPTIEPYEIIPLLNTAWERSFERVLSNRKAIADRGCNPLNRNILLDSTLRATIAETERDTEMTRALVPSRILALNPSTPTTLTNYANATHTSISNSTALVPFTNPRFDPAFLTIPLSEPREKMNYSQGTAALCLDSIVCHEDLMNARERIKCEQNEGKTIV